MLGRVSLKEILLRLEDKHKTSTASFDSHHETAEALSTSVLLLHFLAIAFAVVVIGLFIICPVHDVKHMHLPFSRYWKKHSSTRTIPQGSH
jgi:hypothetical protein